VTVTDPFTTVVVPNGPCPICGHVTTTLRGLVERHKVRRDLASKGGIYAAAEWCQGAGMEPESLAEPEGAAA
jgi:hypothetical protein